MNRASLKQLATESDRLAIVNNIFLTRAKEMIRITDERKFHDNRYLSIWLSWRTMKLNKLGVNNILFYYIIVLKY